MRFDAVYYSHVKCNLRRIVDYQHLWAYTRELYQWPGIAATVDLAQIKAHYHATHPSLNPTRIRTCAGLGRTPWSGAMINSAAI